MIQQGACTVFKTNLLNGLEDFSATTPYTYKIALYTAFAEIGPATTTYTSDGEISGTGYTATGKDLNIIPTTSNQNIGYISFENAEWTSASFTARGALIYNSTTNAAVCVLDFGANKTCTSTFTVVFPAATDTNAIIRLA